MTALSDRPQCEHSKHRIAPRFHGDDDDGAYVLVRVESCPSCAKPERMMFFCWPFWNGIITGKHSVRCIVCHGPWPPEQYTPLVRRGDPTWPNPP